MLKIYVKQNSPRLTYIFNLIFKERLFLEFEITNSVEEFEAHQGPKFEYGTESLLNGLFFFSNGLLQETDLVQIKPTVSEYKETTILFPTENKDSALPFDMFSGAFYLISRYEEYFPRKTDKYGRFRSKESLARKHDFLKEPIIDKHILFLKEVLAKHFPQLNFREKETEFHLTIDVDKAYAYRYQGFWCNVSLFLRLLFSNPKEAINMLFVLSRIKKDPNDSLQSIHSLSDKYQIRPTFFFLVGNNKEKDKNIPIEHPKASQLIQGLANFGCLGLHPSFQSTQEPGLVDKEKTALEKVYGDKVLKSRQHYLKIAFPHTYRKLLDLGIKEDYSMGYPSKIGFRASTSMPFYFFDLEKNEPTDLKVHPFCIMDLTLTKYLRIRSSSVLRYIAPVISNIQQVNGNIMVSFHNEAMPGKGKWKKWHHMYEEIIKMSLNYQ